MEFGAHLGLNDLRTAAAQAKLVEEVGFTHAWFGDVPAAGSGDPYVSMAAAALATNRIKLGTYVAPAPLRDSVTLVSSIATINALAPGRTIMGFGSGSFSLMLMGEQALKVKEFRRRLCILRSLLDRGEAVHGIDAGNEVATIRIQSQRDVQAIKLQPPIPLYVAAGSPKAAALAGEFADGLITADFPVPESLAGTLGYAIAGARRAGRTCERMPFVMEGPICVFHSGEKLNSERVLGITQRFVMLVYKWFATVQVPAEFLPDAARPSYKEYLTHLDGMSIAPGQRHLRICSEIFSNVPGESRFATPEAIHALTLSGSLDEVVDRIKRLERAGLTQLAVWPRDWRWRSDDYLADVRQLMARAA